MKTNKMLCLELMATMDLPSWRVENEDWHWLNRNLHIRNSAHPNFEKVKELIKEILKGWYGLNDGYSGKPFGCGS